MLLQTPVHISRSLFEINPSDRILFVGSCFADNIGQKLTSNKFKTVVNPYGIMYNPVSVRHTVERYIAENSGAEGVDIAVFTLGTNHVYILNETGEIVDNCQKRPQRLFTERELTVEECADALSIAMDSLWKLNAETRIILTVSPIRYAKYGFHGSGLSKAILLLASEKLVRQHDKVSYFPAYEIMNDELRDYRFYRPDMLHPSEQAVDYIFEKFREAYFSKDSIRFYDEWQPIQRALQHRPFNPDSEEYKQFLLQTKQSEMVFRSKWNV